jgi:ring-1,2-phenylacetyl-CoA epoxidase subunit PaaE
LCGPETMIEVVTDVLKEKNGIGYKIWTIYCVFTWKRDTRFRRTYKITVMVDDEETTLKKTNKY